MCREIYPVGAPTLTGLASHFERLATSLVLQLEGALATRVVDAAADCLLVDVQRLQLVLLQRVHARRRKRVQVVGSRQRTAAVRLRVDEIARRPQIKSKL